MKILHKDLDEKDIIRQKTQIISLYEDAKWTSYLKDKQSLINGIKHSLLIIGAYDNEQLIGFIRIEGYFIICIQDVLMKTDSRWKGIGGNLVQRISERYPFVRQKVLLTDNTTPY